MSDKPKSKAVLINFSDAPGLHDALDKYRKSLGWTWKRLILTGMAESIHANKDGGQDLIVAIVDYLEGRR